MDEHCTYDPLRPTLFPFQIFHESKEDLLDGLPIILVGIVLGDAPLNALRKFHQ
jgi:hypothetical protein